MEKLDECKNKKLRLIKYAISVLTDIWSTTILFGFTKCKNPYYDCL